MHAKAFREPFSSALPTECWTHRGSRNNERIPRLDTLLVGSGEMREKSTKSVPTTGRKETGDICKRLPDLDGWFQLVGDERRQEGQTNMHVVIVYLNPERGSTIG